MNDCGHAALYAGSFDPFTNGHLSILKQACDVFDRVYLCISENSNKQRHTEGCLMASAITACLIREGIKNCIVISYDGLVADYCLTKNIKYLVRGLRNTSDYLYEENIAKINNEINPNLRTIYFRGSDDVISSSMIRELLKYGKSVEKYVPKEVSDLLLKQEKD